MFLDEEHKQRFLAAMNKNDQCGKSLWLDREYGATLFLLTSDYGIWETMRPYIISSHRIRFKEYLENVPTSSGEEIVVKVAWTLFNGGGEVSLLDLMRLDAKNFQLVINALRIRHREVKLSEIE